MAEDWDLYAVVRSCKSAATKKGTTISTATTTNTSTASEEDPLACLASLTFEEENDLFSFPHLVEPRNNAFQELQDLCKSFFPTTTGSHGVDPDSAISDLQRRRHPVRPSSTSTKVKSHFKPGSSSSSGFGGVQDQQQRRHAQQQQPQLQQNQPYQPRQQVHQQEFQRTQANTAMSLPTMQSHAPRSRERKSQQKRTVCHVTAENLSSDMWAWRKYGQKPIKGSPYPRNYYRCSSSKGCAARKQVERSNIDPNIFVVTYTGEHTHPRPTHRNSLAGSTRNKCSTSHKSTEKDNSGSPATANAASCSSPQSAASLSPKTPLSVQTDEGAIITKNGNEKENKTVIGGNDKETEEIADDVDDDDNEYEDDHADILIPNMTMTEDMFRGLQELGYSSPGGDSWDSFSDGGRANSGSSWAPCGSAAAATAGAAMGGS